jgi:hypothetical protein
MVCSAELAPGSEDPVLHLIGQRSARYRLSPLTAEQVEQLLLSAFGDVPHVPLLSDRVYRVAQGSPRASMDLARHLIDRGTTRYEGGTWTLPTQLEMSDLPATMAQAFAARVAALSPAARCLADVHALSNYGGLSLQDHQQLAALQGEALESAIGGGHHALGWPCETASTARCASRPWRSRQVHVLLQFWSACWAHRALPRKLLVPVTWGDDPAARWRPVDLRA